MSESDRQRDLTRILEHLVDELDVPSSKYEDAKQRYDAVGAWLNEDAFAELVTLCQFLPGPASSQTGIALGFIRAGFIGGVAAWAVCPLCVAVAVMWRPG